MFTHQPNGVRTLEEEVLEMRRLADERRCPVIMTFRGIEVALNPGGDIAAACTYIASETERRAELDSFEAEYRASSRHEDAYIDPDQFPTFTVRDPDFWRMMLNPQGGFDGDDEEADTYEMKLMLFAARWAHLMETRIHAGEQLEDIAEQTRVEANEEGFNTYATLHAVAPVLCRAWIHGDRLHQWLEPLVRQ